MVENFNIDPIWDMKEVENLNYFFEAFNDPQTTQKWKELYNKEFTIGNKADHRTQQPEIQTSILNEVLTYSKVKLTNPGYIWYKMNPGDVIPYHSDTYIKYCKYHNVSINKVWRALVLLQDWQPGSVLEVDGTPINQYKAGKVVMWNSDTPHFVANYGKIPRYTLQLTLSEI